MERVIKFIPNLFTLGNLTMGFTAIIFVANEQMVSAVLCIGVALILDFLDGFVARMLKADSKLGLQLDSLADLVTFGIAPGMVVFQMIIITKGYYFVPIQEWPLSAWLMASVSSVLPMGAAYRLAVFNLSDKQVPHFQGMPVPAMSLFILSIPLVLETNYNLNFYHPLSDQFIDILAQERKWDASDAVVLRMMFSPLFYQITAVCLSFLMVSKIPMISLKFKGFSWAKNKWKYSLLIWVLICYLIFLVPYLSLPFSWGLIDYLILPIFMIGYFILSVIYSIFAASNESTISDEIQS